MHLETIDKKQKIPVSRSTTSTSDNTDNIDGTTMANPILQAAEENQADPKCLHGFQATISTRKQEPVTMVHTCGTMNEKRSVVY